MSAILGIVYFDGRPVSPERLRPSVEALTGYGGDNEGIWTGAGAGLYATVRHVTPESVREEQPLARNGRVIVADARIDNRAEVFDRLRIDPSERTAMPDSALILMAYERWGQDCPAYLVGDYAFAVWDGRERSLFCARDHIGARPFYYYHKPGLFAFCTDVRGLLALPDVPREIDEEEVGRYLRFPLGGTSSRTFLRGINRLPYANHLRVTARDASLAPYWRPEDRPDLPPASEEEYAEQLRALLTDAVAARVRTTFPVASHLSGGLDSSAVTVLAARQLKAGGQKLAAAQSWSPPRSDEFPEMKRDERLRIENLCRLNEIDLQCYDVTVEDLRDFLRRDPAVYTKAGMVEEWVGVRHAGELGIRTILSGWGGDEAVTFNARGYLAELFRWGRWIRLARLLGVHFGKRPRQLLKTTFFRILVPQIPDALFGHLASVVERFYPPPLVALDFKVHNPAFRAPLQNFARERAGVRRSQYVLFYNGHIAERMEAWAAAGADAGVGYAYPLTDRRLMEFAYAVPTDLHWRKGHTRYLFRRAMDGLVPSDVVWEPSKYDSAVEKRRWRLRIGLWQALAQEAKDDAWGSDLAGWLNRERLKREILNAPDPNGKADLDRYVRIVNALTMDSLWQHQKTCANG